MSSKKVVNVARFAGVVFFAVEQIIVAGVAREDAQERSSGVEGRMPAAWKAREEASATRCPPVLRISIMTYKIQLRGKRGDKKPKLGWTAD